MKFEFSIWFCFCESIPFSPRFQESGIENHPKIGETGHWFIYADKFFFNDNVYEFGVVSQLQ